ncbi:hypothetical protein NPIL_108551 [Nephila pilipes]|uniref:Uncharacterized protein n=1 Tax=Nephila pilipes TaxID=299642 RepID=A0A8X6PSR0_NEPPI|nr:hypothetical protein NPIL_108551 [Nephila pilipes]
MKYSGDYGQTKSCCSKGKRQINQFWSSSIVLLIGCEISSCVCGLWFKSKVSSATLPLACYLRLCVAVSVNSKSTQIQLFIIHSRFRPQEDALHLYVTIRFFYDSTYCPIPL